MRSCDRRLLPLLCLLLAGAPAGAEGPAVDTKHFPNLAHLLLLSEEREVLKSLKDDQDRREFQKIFRARRDPTPTTPANEFEDNVRAVWKRADELFSYPNQKGPETGCGQVLVLLGRPEEVLGKGSGRLFDNMAYLREGSTREPETWVYRDCAALPYHDAFTTADAVASVGPIPLSSYAPGAYVVRLDVTDGVTKQTLRQEPTLEIRVTGGTP